MMEFAREGHIKPVLPMRTFDAAHVSEPFRLMQKAQQIGKMVITMPPRADAELPSEAAHEPFRARSDAAYLLTGGLGGLGRSVSTWLAERGARHFVFLSRSAAKPEHDAFFQELACLGCTSIRVSGDVANYDDVVRAVKAASRPICGVLHASMVLEDNSFLDMSFDQWSVPIRPKVEGAWNLHKALSSEKLDFFFLFSSFGAMFGQWGQANYSASNTFVDAFVGYRHSLGLPASTVNIGVMGDVGWVAENPEALEKLQAAASHVSQESDFLECAELMFMRPGPMQQLDPKRFVQHSQVGFGLRSTLPILAPNNRVVFRKDPRMLVYRNLEADAGWSAAATTHGQAGADPADEELTRFLQGAAVNMAVLRGEEAMALLARNVGRTLFGFMLRPEDEFDVHAPMADVGIDSLVSIELRNWITKRLGVEVNVLEITRAGSLLELGGLLQTRMVEKYQARR
jgi:NAD(P)-dependent dehydrogenase (short-subunit alcohol dehydrogenase family)